MPSKRERLEYYIARCEEWNAQQQWGDIPADPHCRGAFVACKRPELSHAMIISREGDHLTLAIPGICMSTATNVKVEHCKRICLPSPWLY